MHQARKCPSRTPFEVLIVERESLIGVGRQQFVWSGSGVALGWLSRTIMLHIWILFMARSFARRRFVVALALMTIVVSMSGCVFRGEGDVREDTVSGEVPMPVEHYVLVIDIKTHKTGPEASILVRMRRSGTGGSGGVLGVIGDTEGNSRESDPIGGTYIPDLFTCEGDDCLARVLVVVPEDLIADTPVEWTAHTSVGGAASDAFSWGAGIELTVTPTLKTDMGYPPDWAPTDR